MPFRVSYLSLLLQFPLYSDHLNWSLNHISFCHLVPNILFVYDQPMCSFHSLTRSSSLKPSLPFSPSCIFPLHYLSHLSSWTSPRWRYCLVLYSVLLIPGQPRLSWLLLLPFSFDFSRWCIVTCFLLIYCAELFIRHLLFVIACFTSSIHQHVFPRSLLPFVFPHTSSQAFTTPFLKDPTNPVLQNLLAPQPFLQIFSCHSSLTFKPFFLRPTPASWLSSVSSCPPHLRPLTGVAIPMELPSHRVNTFCSLYPPMQSRSLFHFHQHWTFLSSLHFFWYQVFARHTSFSSQNSRKFSLRTSLPYSISSMHIPSKPSICSPTCPLKSPRPKTNSFSFCKSHSQANMSHNWCFSDSGLPRRGV